jgi:hypothetical protein
MSWSVYLQIHTGVEFAEVAEVGNMTYNVHAMYVKAMGFGLREFDGKTAEDCIATLDFGIANMKADPATYEALNPPNGWGNYESALKFLELFVGLCRGHPATRVRVS